MKPYKLNEAPNDWKEQLNSFVPKHKSANWGSDSPVSDCFRSSYLPASNPVADKKEPQTENGIFFGKDLIMPIESDYFAAVFGGTSSGKTSIIMKHTLFETWNKPFVAIDIKGDLCKEYQTLENSRKASVLSFRDELEQTYDPLQHVREGCDEDKVSNIEEIVNALIELPVNTRDPFWIESERSLVTAGMLFFYNRGMDDFTAIMVTIATTPLNKLIQEIADSDDDEAKIFINHFITECYDEKSDTYFNVVACETKMLVCIGQGITNKLKIFSDPRIARVLAKSDNQVKWTDLDDYNVFISVPEDRLSRYGGILSMIITQLVRAMERRPEMHTPEGQNQQKVLLALDEFARLGKMDIIADAVSTLRSKGITVLLVMQSLAQLDRIYGKDTRRIIMENMSYFAILRVTDTESQEYFSKLIGTSKVKRVSYSTGVGGGTYSEQTSESHEPTVWSHKFRTLKDMIVLTPDDDNMSRVDKEFYHSKETDEEVSD